MVKPGGTGRPALVISARPAPFPPRRSRRDAFPSRKSQTHFVPAPCGVVFSGAAVAIAAESPYLSLSALATQAPVRRPGRPPGSPCSVNLERPQHGLYGANGVRPPPGRRAATG